jgi:hypothetical protein
MKASSLILLSSVVLFGSYSDFHNLPGAGGGLPAFGGERGGSFDASNCSASPRPAPRRLACLADANSPRLAVGICGNLTADNTLMLDAGNAARNLDVSGTSHTTSPLHVAGSFVSLTSLSSDNTEDITADISTAGVLTVTAPVHVGGNAFVGQSVQATNTLDIKGILHVGTAVDMTNVHASSFDVGPVPIADPLDCADATDVISIVGNEFVSSVDGQDLGRDSLTKVSAPSQLTLGCGTYDFTSIETDNTLDIEINGPTVMFVRDDFHVASPTTIHVANGATFDLAIGGSLRVDNTLSITSDSPDDSVWIGVGADVHVAAPVTLSGELFAPKGTLESDNTVDIAGSLFVGSMHVASPIGVHFGTDVDPRGCMNP